jgi:nicotinamidase-related amidase
MPKNTIMRLKDFRPVFILVLLALSCSVLCFAESNNTALVVIDMQDQFIERGEIHNRPDNVEKVEQIFKFQIATIRSAVEAKIPIIFMEYRGHGETNTQLKQAVGDYSNVKFFVKAADGMFDDEATKKRLVAFLNENGIKNLIITGANGGACVANSIRGALENEYSVVPFTKGIADFNYDEFIYPYENRFNDMEKKCKTCTLSEVSSLESVKEVIQNGKMSARSTLPKNVNQNFEGAR